MPNPHVPAAATGLPADTPESADLRSGLSRQSVGKPSRHGGEGADAVRTQTTRHLHPSRPSKPLQSGQVVQIEPCAPVTPDVFSLKAQLGPWPESRGVSRQLDEKEGGQVAHLSAQLGQKPTPALSLKAEENQSPKAGSGTSRKVAQKYASVSTRLRARMSLAVERLILALDLLDALGEDLEDADPAEEDGDDEPINGSINPTPTLSQTQWSAGTCYDTEVAYV